MESNARHTDRWGENRSMPHPNKKADHDHDHVHVNVDVDVVVHVIVVARRFAISQARQQALANKRCKQACALQTRS